VHDRGLTSINAKNFIVDVKVRRCGGCVGVLDIHVSPVIRENDGGILNQLAIESLKT
jgi:hypothetical protein